MQVVTEQCRACGAFDGNKRACVSPRPDVNPADLCPAYRTHCMRKSYHTCRTCQHLMTIVETGSPIRWYCHKDSHRLEHGRDQERCPEWEPQRQYDPRLTYSK